MAGLFFFKEKRGVFDNWLIIIISVIILILLVVIVGQIMAPYLK